MKVGMCAKFEKTEEGFVLVDAEDIIKCGFDYIELGLVPIANLEEEDLEDFGQFLKCTGYEPYVCNLFFPGDIRLTGPDFDKDKIATYAKKALSRAANLGFKKFVLGSGGSRNIPSGFSKEEANKQLLLAIDIIIEICEENNVQLVLEHLNNFESNIMNRFEQTAKLSKEKNSPYFKSILDVYHFNVGNENPQLVIDYGKEIGHAHYAMTVRRAFPISTDYEEFSADLQYLKDCGYNATISMECANVNLSDNIEEYKKSVKMFRDFFN